MKNLNEDEGGGAPTMTASGIGGGAPAVSRIAGIGAPGVSPNFAEPGVKKKADINLVTEILRRTLAAK